MRNKVLFLAAIGASLVSSGAVGQEAPKSQPTARDVYVSCSLLVRNTDVPRGTDGQLKPYSATVCSLQALAAMGLREGRSKDGDNSRRFCLPQDAQTQQRTVEVMAYGYIDVFENQISHMANGPGKEAFLAAMILKWPCK